jgi:hypothetical protein
MRKRYKNREKMKKKYKNREESKKQTKCGVRYPLKVN